PDNTLSSTKRRASEKVEGCLIRYVRCSKQPHSRRDGSVGVTEECLRLNSCCELGAFISIAFSGSRVVRDIWISRDVAASLPANSSNILPLCPSFPFVHIQTFYYFIFPGQSLE